MKQKERSFPVYIYIMVHILFTLYTIIFCYLTEAYHSNHYMILLSKTIMSSITFK